MEYVFQAHCDRDNGLYWVLVYRVVDSMISQTADFATESHELLCEAMAEANEWIEQDENADIEE